MTIEEIKKDVMLFHRIKDHPNYGVNKCGEVCNIKKKTLLKPIKDSKGYLRVRLDGKRVMVSRLVAELFVNNPKSKPKVAYKDGDKTNVKFSNLIWATNSEIHRPDKLKRVH